MKELVQLRPAIILIIRLLRIEVKVCAEGDVVLWLSIAEHRWHRVHIEHSVSEGDQPLVLVDLVRKLLVEKQLTALIHHTLLEASLLQSLDDIRIWLLLLFRLAHVACIGIVLTWRAGQVTCELQSILLEHVILILLHHVTRQPGL